MMHIVSYLLYISCQLQSVVVWHFSREGVIILPTPEKWASDTESYVATRFYNEPQNYYGFKFLKNTKSYWYTCLLLKHRSKMSSLHPSQLLQLFKPLRGVNSCIWWLKEIVHLEWVIKLKCNTKLENSICKIKS